MKTKRPAFTLIELLVVIAIIAILAAILFPVFVEAKERGRQAKCLSNLKQLMMAVREYCDDHNGIMPFCIQQQSGRVPDWAGCYVCGTLLDLKDGGLWSYVRNRAVYACPTDINKKRQDLTPNLFPLSYSMNYVMGNNMDTIYPCQKNIRLDVESAGRASRILILIHESRNSINDGYFAWINNYDIPSDVHWSGSTVVYADTHAKYSPRSRLIQDRDNHEWEPNTLYYSGQHCHM